MVAAEPRWLGLSQPDLHEWIPRLEVDMGTHSEIDVVVIGVGTRGEDPSLDVLDAPRARSHRGPLGVRGRSGQARLAGPRTVAVGDEVIAARRGVVIATGSQPAIQPIPGLVQVDYWTTRDVIIATELSDVGRAWGRRSGMRAGSAPGTVRCRCHDR